MSTRVPRRAAGPFRSDDLRRDPRMYISTSFLVLLLVRELPFEKH